MYSLRVPLTEDLERRLKSYAHRSGEDYCSIVRSYIETLPLERGEFSYEKYKQKHKRACAKLEYWLRKCGLEASELIERMYHCETATQLYSFFVDIKTEGKVSRQAVSLLGELSPRVEGLIFDVGENSLWYDGLQPGEYVVLEEKEVDGFSYRGSSVGIVTINSYESKILNTPDMMIVDVDTNKSSEDIARDSVVVASTQFALDTLSRLVETVCPDLSFRAYKTANGLRYICANTPMEVHCSRTKGLMQAMCADPLYQNLCRFQETYRARLDVKPWRSDPCSDTDEAVCEFLGVYGSTEEIDPRFKAMIEYHDRCTLSENNEAVLA